MAGSAAVPSAYEGMTLEALAHLAREYERAEAHGVAEPVRRCILERRASAPDPDNRAVHGARVDLSLSLFH
ncbi:MAG: hypothetical protein FJ086_18285 [Deltaproteobacteria bacterium]|nr:hypothetical protein [Deltaproteobacteria bacterium]